ncbi:MAG: hypothetical protein ACE5JX_10935 [Acidobacteriota bacterium]
MTKPNSPPALVLGCHKIGLGVIRALGIERVPVVAVYYHRADMGHVSKHIVARYRCPNPNHEELDFVNFLQGLSQRWGGSVLIPSDDATLVPVSKHKALLQPHFKVAANEWDITRAYVEKQHTYALAEKVGVPCPRTGLPRSLEEAIDFLDQVGWPCIIKPSVSHRFYELFGSKMLVARNQAEFVEAYRAAEEYKIPLLLQELIPGDDTCGVNYNSYRVEGEVVSEFTARKVRLTPPGIGFPRVVVSRDLPEVHHLGRKILKALNYQGFSCTEFKQDQRDGAYKLMEVNGRHNLSSLLAVACGLNFPYLNYRHLVDGKVPRGNFHFRTGVYWIDLERDFLQSVRSYRQERLPLRNYLHPYLSEHVFAVWSLQDPYPFLKRLADAALWGPASLLEKAGHLFQSKARN